MAGDANGPSNTDQLSAALGEAKAELGQRSEDPALDLEPVLRAALARHGLTWELVEHRLQTDSEQPILHATFKLAHPSSGQSENRNFPIPLTTAEPTDTTLQNALAYLWTHALREILHVPGRAEGLSSHMQPTMKIPKITDE